MARIGLTKDKVEAPIEYFSFIRSGMDVFCGYKDYDELKRMRQAYIVHVCDQILQERHRVYKNSLAIAIEEASCDEVVHVGNVFEIARKNEGEQVISESEGEDEAQLPLRTIEGERIRACQEYNGNDRRDQGFTRAKVLILCPFKQTAY